MEYDSIKSLESAVFHTFQDLSILHKSLLHRSMKALTSQAHGDNQRLEFLGDRVLGLIIAHILFERYEEEEEGALARRHATLVSRAAITRVARRMGLGNHLMLSPGEEGGGGRFLDSVLEDACEALIGALYLDGGMAAAERFVRHYWAAMIEESPEPPKDAKTALQEWAQAHGLPLPSYIELERGGPAHAPRFIMEASIGPERTSLGEGTTKKAAEQAAAAALMEKLNAE